LTPVFAGVGSGLKLDFSLRTQFNITRRLLGHKPEILIVCCAKADTFRPPPPLLFCLMIFNLQVAGDNEAELPLSVSFPPGGRGAYKPIPNMLPSSVQSLKERFISAVANEDRDFLLSNAAAKGHDRFGTDMLLRADSWQELSADGILRNESSPIDK
jgi:hypothetical protein